MEKKHREPITIESLLSELDEISSLLDEEIEKRRKSTDKNRGIKFLRKIRKRVEITKKHVPKVKRKSQLNRDPTKSGFVIPYPISKELSEFLNVDPNSKLSRDDVQCAISAYIHIAPTESREKICRWEYLNKEKRDLRNIKNKRIVNPDDKLSSLLNYEQYKKDVKNGLITIKQKKSGDIIPIIDDSLQYYVIMRLIQPHFKKN